MCFTASAPGTLAKKDYKKVETTMGTNLTDPVTHYVQMEGLRDLNRIEKNLVGTGQESDILNWERNKVAPAPNTTPDSQDNTLLTQQQAAEDAAAEERRKQRRRRSRRTTILTSGQDTTSGYGLGSGTYGKKTLGA